MDLISLLVFLIVLGLVFWAVRALGAAFGLPAPIITVVYVLLVVFAVLYMLQAIGGLSSGPRINLR